MSAQTRNQINLLPEANFEDTTTGRILSWILSTFRIIVIVTELIVMVAFLSRFWLDAQNTDLNDEIERNVAVLNSSKNFEKEFENIQKRLRVFSELTENQGIYTDALHELVSYLPPDLYLTTVTFKGDSFFIEGSTSNEISIQQLMVNLLSTEKFSEISLSELATDTKDTNLINFKLDTVLEKEKI